MSRNLFLIITLLLVPLIIPLTGFSQQFNKEEQYKQAMANAKMALAAKKYSEAVVFYREALSIKPEAQLPRYKIEDIRTIYIEKELAKLEPKNVNKKKRSKKDTKKEDDPIRKQAEIQADQIIAIETKAVENELKELKIEAKAIQIEDDEKISIDSSLIKNIESDREIIMPKKEIIEQTQITSNVKDEPTLTVKPIENKTAVIQPADTLPKQKQPEIKKAETRKTESIKTTPVQMSAEEKIAWKQKEQERLKVIYPNKKTIEEEDKPGRHITRIIMNVDSQVLIYLKVKHDWGGLFFFIDNPGEELRSISEQYFNQMTNLDTYGN